MPLLRGLDGVQKMGKSVGNFIGVAEPANVQFQKTMSIPDGLMREWFTLLTDRDPTEFDRMSATNPMEAKKTLAADIVTAYHGADAARQARSEWERQFSQKVDPENILEASLPRTDLMD